MPEYKRFGVSGGTYFFTLVTYKRYPWLCNDIARSTLREGIEKVRIKYPFEIDAFILLPEHLHCIWTLPDGDVLRQAASLRDALRVRVYAIFPHVGD